MKKILFFISLVFLVSCGGSLTEAVRNAQDYRMGSEERINASVVSVTCGEVANLIYLYDIEHKGRSYTIFYSTSGDIFVIENK